MVITLKMPVNLKIPMPRMLPKGFLEPILKPLWRGPKTAGTVLHDRVALHKSLFLCPSCVSKMGRVHLKCLGYVELKDYHGYGLCDGADQEEQPCAMWMWEGSKHIQRQNEDAKWQEVSARERAVRERWRR